MGNLIKDEKIRWGNYEFNISYVSEKGGRYVNEDSIAIEHVNESLLLSIADGLGAHGGGDIASGIAIRIAKEEYMHIAKTNAKCIYKAFQNIDNAIVAKHTNDIKMKTTLSCVLFRKKWIYATHLGDTRTYIFEKERILSISADHSIAYDEVMKKHGTLDDIRKNPNRHILSAALGVGKIRPPDFFKKKISEKLSVLVCSDGFWEYVREDEMLKSLTHTKTSHEWLRSMLKCHSEKADIFNDNYSAICLRIIKNKGGRNPCNSKV